MIRNTCIYGTIVDGDDTPIIDTVVGLKYIKYDFSKVLEKEFENTSGAYQFNLGDSDMLTLETGSNVGDVCVVRHEDTYSDKIVLTGNKYYEWNIVDDGSLVETDVEADSVDESTNKVVKAIILNESSEDLYNLTV